MQGQCSEAEWKARVDLAACYRLVELYGMADMMANHISMRVPDEENAFLINAYGMMYEEITASSLIKVDLAGNVMAKPDFGELGYGINKAGYVIHSAVHAARHDVDCVIHTHRDRKSVGSGKGVSVRVNHGWSRISKQKKKT